MRAFLTKLFAALPVDQCRHRIGKVGLRIGLRRAPLRFDENRPSRAQPPQGIVEPGGDGHEFGGRGTVEIGTAKARRALKRSVLVEHHARPHQCDPGEEVCETRSEEHTSELQSLMRISYAVFCLKKKKKIARL